MLDLSIIVPVYNVEKYLDECVRSLINQNNAYMHYTYEIILIDDGSTDNSGDICNYYASQYDYIRVIHKRNGGLGSARNVGFDNSTADYILFVDSDDYLEKNCIGNMLKIAKTESLDILLFCAYSFSEDGTKIQTTYSRTKASFNHTMSGVVAYKDDIRNNEYRSTVCLRLMRRDFIVGTGVRFNEQYIHEDEDYSFLTYIQAKRVQVIQDEYYKRRYRPGSILTSRTFQKTFDGYSYAAKSIMEYSIKLDSEQISLCKQYHAQLILLIITQYCMLNKWDKSAYRSQIEELLSQTASETKTENKRIQLASKSLDLYMIVYNAKQIVKKILKK